jgi:hypothetical protein
MAAKDAGTLVLPGIQTAARQVKRAEQCFSNQRYGSDEGAKVAQ